MGQCCTKNIEKWTRGGAIPATPQYNEKVSCHEKVPYDESLDYIATTPPPPGFECPICLDSDDESPVEALPCAHVFHGHCLGKWFNRQRVCPLCEHSADNYAQIDTSTLGIE